MSYNIYTKLHTCFDIAATNCMSSLRGKIQREQMSSYVLHRNERVQFVDLYQNKCVVLYLVQTLHRF